MRYFFVSTFNGNKNTFNTYCFNSENFPSTNTIGKKMKEKNNYVILNIQELTKQDYNDFIGVESQQEGSEGK